VYLVNAVRGVVVDSTGEVIEKSRVNWYLDGDGSVSGDRIGSLLVAILGSRDQ
jgi:hypothetical protein